MKLKVGLIALVLLAAIFCARNLLVRQMVEGYLAGRTDLPVQVGQARVGLASCSLALRDVRLSKGAEAAGDPLLVIDRFEVDTRVKPLLEKKFQVESMTVELAYLHLIRHADGTTNLRSLAGQLVSGKNKPGVPAAPTPAAHASGPKPATTPPSWTIDYLDLYIGQIEVTDYARGSTPAQLTLTLNTRRAYHNISSLDQVLQPLQDEFLGSILEKKF